MPHLQIQFSEGLDARHDMDGLCAALGREILALGYYPEGGLRVRAMKADHVYIADGSPQNAFLDAVFRIGEGRSEAQKSETGEALMRVFEAEFGDILTNGYLMLSLEIIEISKAYSWKKNSVHQRLAAERE